MKKIFISLAGICLLVLGLTAFQIVNPGGGSGGASSITAGSSTGIIPGLADYYSSTPANAAIAGSGNQVRVLQFTLLKTLAFNKATWWVQAGAGDTVDFAIYSADGNTKLVDVGATVSVGAAAVQTVTSLATSATLSPGTYYFAWTQTATTTTFLELPFATQNFNLFINTQTVKRMGTAANSATAGALPTTLGAITAVGVSVPAVYFEP